jgi:CheY-like chemotaxis protein/anti-sigma regulatory factor (Ser/Thr protein kinase)
MDILVVDDTPANRKLLARALAGWGYEVREAASGTEGIEACRQRMPDVVLMDIMMPGMNGMEAARFVRDLPGGKELSIIFITALKEGEGLVEALGSGGDDYITKPVALDVLQAKLKAHARIRELSRALAERNRLLAQHNRELRREQEIISHFFERAQEQNFLPPEMLRYRASSRTAFSGDLLLSRRRPGGGLYLMLGDFTGHGLSAAMGSLPVTETFSRMAHEGLPVGVIARELNRLLNASLPEEIFCAATLLELDATGEFLGCWAGGLPNGYARTPTGEMITLGSHHMPLGILGDGDFDETLETFKLPVGTRIYLMTDGITDARGTDGEAFGEARAAAVIVEAPPGSNVLEVLQREAAAYSGRSSARDDVAIVELECQALVPESDVLADMGRGTYPVSLHLRVSANDLADGGVIRRLIDMLGVMPIVFRRRAELHTVFAELLTNTIDHGLLARGRGRDYDDAEYFVDRESRLREIGDRHVDITVALGREREHWLLEVSVEHDGEARAVDLSLSDDEDAHGRGLLLLEALCEDVRIENQGRRTRVRYRFEGLTL